MPEKTLKERETAFAETLKEFAEKYERQMLLDFFYYWTEPNKSQTKMKFEMEKTWDTARRLRTWERNNINWNKNGNQHGKTGKNYPYKPIITGEAEGAGSF